MLQLSHSSYFACWRGNKNYIRGSKYSLQCSLTFIFFSYHLAIILVYEHHAIFFYCKVYLWILASQNHVFFVINQKSWRSIFHSGQQWNEYFPSALIHYFTLLQNCGRCNSTTHWWYLWSLVYFDITLWALAEFQTPSFIQSFFIPSIGWKIVQTSTESQWNIVAKLHFSQSWHKGRSYS